MDRYAQIEEAGADAIKAVAVALGVPETKEAVFPLLMAAMGEDKMKIYRLAVHFASEMEICVKQEAYFSGCLMGASAVEAFLALASLQEQSFVEKTTVYKHAKKKSKDYRDTVADLTFDKLARISDELEWLDKELVSEDILVALITDFPELAKTVYPDQNESAIQARCDALSQRPGPEMLILLRDLRNLIHPPRWLKNNCILDDQEFRSNCRLATVVSTEIVQCL